MPTLDIKKINQQLIDTLETSFWKGDLKRFGTNGSQDGLFLLPNYSKKDIWFPTYIKIKPEPFSAVIENNGRQYSVFYKDEKLIIE